MDPIADFLIALKNASAAGKAAAIMPYSNLRMAIAQILKREGFVADVSEKGKEKKSIEVSLRYAENGAPKIADVKRLSKPSKRVYMSVHELKPVRQGYGLLVLSTPKGVMSAREAKKAHVGGEALFTIW